jgi:hypothetical protein
VARPSRFCRAVWKQDVNGEPLYEIVHDEIREVFVAPRWPSRSASRPRQNRATSSDFSFTRFFVPLLGSAVATITASRVEVADNIRRS